MKIQLTSYKGDFEIKPNQFKTLNLQYPLWYSSYASTKYNKETIELSPKNIWGSKFEIIKNKKVFGEIKFHTLNSIKIRLKRKKANEEILLLKTKGIWPKTFLLENENKEVLLEFNPKVERKEIDFTIELRRNALLSNKKAVVLIIYSCFGLNLFISSYLIKVLLALKGARNNGKERVLTFVHKHIVV